MFFSRNSFMAQLLSMLIGYNANTFSNKISPKQFRRQNNRHLILIVFNSTFNFFALTSIQLPRNLRGGGRATLGHSRPNSLTSALTRHYCVNLVGLTNLNLRNRTTIVTIKLANGLFNYLTSLLN